MESSAQVLAAEFHKLSAHLSTDAHPVMSHQRIVDLVRRVVPTATWAGITSWPNDGAAHTLACSPGFPCEADAIQYQLTEGPCMSAASEGWTSLSPDLGQEARWRRFVAQTLERTQVRGVLALPLAGAPGRHALNLYSDRAGAFQDDVVAIGNLFATHAGMLMAHAESAHKVRGLEIALETSRLIGAASGVLMTTLNISQDTAFQVLRRTSNRLNRKLRDVAVDVISTGQLPRS